MGAIGTRGLTKRLGETVAVNGLNLKGSDGEIYSLLGPNGAGKSTTINILLSQELEAVADVNIDGRTVRAVIAGPSEKHTVIDAVGDAGFTVATFEVREPSLETLFTNYTTEDTD